MLPRSCGRWRRGVLRPCKHVCYVLAMDPSRPRYRRVMWLSLALSVACIIVLQNIDRSLCTPATPRGIVSFEFTWNSATAQRMLDSWDQNERLQAALSIGLDYLFMYAYGALAWSLMRLRAMALDHARRPRLAQTFRSLSFAAWAAVLCDAVENIAMWRMLFGPMAPWPLLGSILATIKFSLIGLLLALWVATWPIVRTNAPNSR